MSGTSTPQAVDIYARAFGTMCAVVDALRDQPDPDGTLGTLAERIDAEREWVLAMMVLGEEPRRPPEWLRRPHACVS